MVKAGKRSAGEAGLEPTKSRKARASKANQQTSHIEDVSDSEEDPGHSMSMHFLAMAKEQARRSNTALTNFNNAVEERKQKFTGSLDGKALKVETQNTQIQRSLITILSDSLRGHTEEDATEPKPTPPPIHQTAKSLITSSKLLLERYYQICQQVKSGEDILRIESGWDEDSKKLQKILKDQGKVAMREIRGLLHESSRASKEKPTDDMSEAEGGDLWKQYATLPSKAKDEPSRGGDGWAVATKHAQRGVQRLVKHIPEDK